MLHQLGQQGSNDLVQVARDVQRWQVSSLRRRDIELDALECARSEARHARSWREYCRYLNNALAYWLSENEAQS